MTGILNEDVVELKTSSSSSGGVVENGGAVSTVGSSASTALSVLLREDPLLLEHQLTEQHSSGDEKSDIFAYAAALLHQEDGGWMSSSGNITQRAKEALAEVDRKLLLVESLAERISREKPEDVAGPLLHLHGYTVTPSSEDTDNTNSNSNSNSNSSSSSVTLAGMRERCDRLCRQGDVLEGVAKRVEGTVRRGLTRMQGASQKLERVLQTSATLKMAMRLRFEAKKIIGNSLLLDDRNDIVRAAASVAIMEQLLENWNHDIHIMDGMRPEVERVAQLVRQAASKLIDELISPLDNDNNNNNHSNDNNHTNNTNHQTLKLGTTMQVYHSLQELPDATWKIVTAAYDRAEKAGAQLWNSSAMKKLVISTVTATTTIASNSSDASDKAASGDNNNNERLLKRQLRMKRAEVATKWAAAVKEAAYPVWMLHRVLTVKTDPHTRQTYLDIVLSHDIPEKFAFSDKSLFVLFWKAVCQALGQRIQKLLKFENGIVAKDVAGLFPAIRSAALDMVGSLTDTMQASSDYPAAKHHHSHNHKSQSLGFTFTPNRMTTTTTTTAETSTTVGADSWTCADYMDSFLPDVHTASSPFMTEQSEAASNTTNQSLALSSIFSSQEWRTLEGSGLAPLQREFLQNLRNRLLTPVESLFAEAVTVDENGVPLPVLPTLPSNYDLKKMESTIQQELALADPREGGGDYSMTTMISEHVVDMVEHFCQAAASATTNVGEEGCLNDKGMPTPDLLHDINIARVMSTLAKTLRTVPSSTFIAPYRPAQSPQQEEAANMCQIALLPALHEMDSTVKRAILNPLSTALNKRIGNEIAKLHRGIYLESSTSGNFIPNTLEPLYNTMATHILSKLPPEYASMVANSIAAYSLYCFVSNASLVRPMGEMGRLRLTQDLADFELALEQLLHKIGSTTDLSQVQYGKPYAELRAVRHLLFWNGLDRTHASSADLAKQLMREPWIKDLRPSTLFHVLISWAPKLLSSPHHSLRQTAQQYVNTLVRFDASVHTGESQSLITILSCCDAYQQRESVGSSTNNNTKQNNNDKAADGDVRIASILTSIGPELLRRQRQ